jgi:hypothetical protein
MPFREPRELGVVTLECRQLPIIVQITCQGNQNATPFARFCRLIYIALMLLVCSFLVSIWVGVPLGMAFNKLAGPSRVGFVLIWITVFATALAYLASLTFFWPQRSYLRVHEFGISGKWPSLWRRFSVRFEDIECLAVGEKSSPLLDRILALDPRNRDLISLRNFAFNNSISLILRDKSKTELCP